ncbi:MAG: paraquat-inducible protein A [Nevskiales bacterium]|nr:paraquat-inducible protein A [Nevskiales bacterium]
MRTGAELGLVSCPGCGLIYRVAGGEDGQRMYCCRCGAGLHLRKPDTLARTWALLIAAALLYLPANVMPIMFTATLFEQRADTILGGVAALWRDGAWDIAIVVFVASVVVPILKIGVLAYLLISVQRGTTLRQRERSHLFRIIEFVGHWSMLDVFVVALLVGLVHFRTFADVQPGPGAVAFAAVVVLTMLASMSFDPRLIWGRVPRTVRDRQA